MSEMRLKIFTPDKMEFDGNVECVDVPLPDGRYTVLKNHASAVFLLSEGVCKFVANGKEYVRVINGGVMRVNDNVVTVTSDFIEEETNVVKAIEKRNKKFEEEEKRRKISYGEYEKNRVVLLRAMKNLHEKK